MARRPALAKAGGQLQQQRRFADAGLAADQQRRARHDAAAGDAIELGEPGRHARDLVVARRAPASRSSTTRPFEDLRQAGARRGRRVGLLDEVFHSPQAAHLPAQRGATAPQFWHTKVLRGGLGHGGQLPAPS